VRGSPGVPVPNEPAGFESLLHRSLEDALFTVTVHRAAITEDPESMRQLRPREIIAILFLLSPLLAGAPASAFDHGYTDYGELLSKHVVDGRVDYAAMLADRGALDGLLEACARVSFDEYETFSRARQLCFMINLYNAATLVLILDHYPVESIKDVGGIFSSPWNRKFIRLFDRTVGLGHIEHDVLRSEFHEPRIHFTIARASIGGPWLIGEPYLPEKLEQQLTSAERHFLTERPEINRYEQGTLHLSPILKWFATDFGGKDGVRSLARQYFPEVNRDTRIRYTDFDWNLNIKPR